MITLALRGVVATIGGVALVAVGWEIFERSVSTARLPIYTPTADWRSDIIATVGGAVLFAVVGVVASLVRT
jgi:hypothetical protein